MASFPSLLKETRNMETLKVEKKRKKIVKKYCTLEVELYVHCTVYKNIQLYTANANQISGQNIHS